MQKFKAPYSGFDWVGFFVRFIFGASMGAVLAFALMSDYWNPIDIQDKTHRTAFVVAFACGTGILSAIFGDRFWKISDV